jgi:hypothetical protein
MPRTAEQMVVDAIREHIDTLPAAESAAVSACIQALKDMGERYPAQVWGIAVAMIGAEMAAS